MLYLFINTYSTKFSYNFVKCIVRITLIANKNGMSFGIRSNRVLLYIHVYKVFG